MPRLRGILPANVAEVLGELDHLETLPTRLAELNLSSLDLEALAYKISTELESAGVPEASRNSIVAAIRAGQTQSKLVLSIGDFLAHALYYVDMRCIVIVIVAPEC